MHSKYLNLLWAGALHDKAISPNFRYNSRSLHASLSLNYSFSAGLGVDNKGDELERAGTLLPMPSA